MGGRSRGGGSAGANPSGGRAKRRHGRTAACRGDDREPGCKAREKEGKERFPRSTGAGRRGRQRAGRTSSGVRGTARRHCRDRGHFRARDGDDAARVRLRRRSHDHGYAAVKARHFRHELRPRRQPADHSRTRQLSHSHARERHRHARCVRHLRRPRHPRRSAICRPCRGRARPGDAALRQPSHRWRYQRGE